MRLIVSKDVRPPLSQTLQADGKPNKPSRGKHFRFHSNTLVVKMEDRHRVKIPQSQIVCLPGQSVGTQQMANYTMADITESNPRYQKLNRRLRLKQPKSPLSAK